MFDGHFAVLGFVFSGKAISRHNSACLIIRILFKMDYILGKTDVAAEFGTGVGYILAKTDKRCPWGTLHLWANFPPATRFASG